MCSINVRYNELSRNWFYYLYQFQTLTMALTDLQRLESGKKLQYIFDGYDFCHWFYKEEIKTGAANPHHKAIRDTWNRFFSLSNGVETCAVMSPFTIIEFLHTISIQIDRSEIIKTLGRNPEINILFDLILKGEKEFKTLPGNQQNIIRNLYAQIVENKKAIDIFSQSGPFSQLKELIELKKIQFFNPLIPEAAQVNELLDYDPLKTDDALNYLQYSRKERSNYSDIYNTLDVYHFILVENSVSSFSANSVVPYLTSSGIFSRNSWYKLKYGCLPNFANIVIPFDWYVRTIDAPTIVLSALAYHTENKSIKKPENTQAFIEDARSIARIIKQDFQNVDEIRLSVKREERERLEKENPICKISSKTLELMQRLNNNYLQFLTNEIEENDSFKKSLMNIERQEVTEMQEYLDNAKHYEDQKTIAKENVQNSIQQIELPYRDMHNYIAPLGDGAFDLLDSIEKNLGLDM